MVGLQSNPPKPGDYRCARATGRVAAAGISSPRRRLSDYPVPPFSHTHHHHPATPRSFTRYASERDAILSSLSRRAVKLQAALCKLEGVTCESPEGALYVFPSLALPPKAVAAAAAVAKAADTFYCLALLDATGIVVVPGSGFGQVRERG